MTSGRTLSGEPFLAPNADFSALFDCAFDGIALWEADPWRISYANPAFWRLADVPMEVCGAELGFGDVPLGLSVRLAELLDRFRGNGADSSTLTACVDGGPEGKPVEVRLCHVKCDDKQFVGTIMRAVSGKQPPRDLGDVARQDPLTGLADREFLMQRVATLLEGERTVDRQFAVVFLDLDNFKQVNDEFGHLIGDNVLREAARRIAGCLRNGDRVVRYGGDEFVAIVEGVTSATEVEPVIGRIHLALASPIAVPGGLVSLSLSAGVAWASEAGGSPAELLAAADRAMYAAKRAAVQPHACGPQFGISATSAGSR
jgi:diguanylate cyclase (GGDEF)-like protein